MSINKKSNLHRPSKPVSMSLTYLAEWNGKENFSHQQPSTRGIFGRGTRGAPPPPSRHFKLFSSYRALTYGTLVLYLHN